MDDLDHARRQRDAMIRERRRDFYRVVATMVIVGVVITLLLAGALTWLGRL